MEKVACSRAIAYYRLSEKDKEKAVSDSIDNQRKLIREYVARVGNIELVGELYDDGYTGTNYDRPGFNAVMDAVHSGKVDCIIVKDLSRLGREYIETGKYLERVFPALGVRFIAVNDDYDSDRPRQSDDILVPVKNLMNETYCRDLSLKLRRQFQVQRRNGEYIGAFASYGYCKSPDDKHRLIVDEYAAEIVRGIFYAKMQGYSQQAIADALNEEGVLPPSEYKRQQGLKYKSGFRTASTPKWSVSAVTNILKNRIYIGDLIQGKRGTPNFKIKTVRVRDPEEWVVVKNCHEAIINPQVFEIVQNMMCRDTRTSPDEDKVHPLGGVLFCFDCGRSMVLRSVNSGKKKFYYYICSTYKHGGGCNSHNFAKGKLEDAVLNAIQLQIQMVVELNELLLSIKSETLCATKARRIQTQIEQKNKELEECREFKNRLYEALSENLIDRDEFTRMQDRYRLRETECQSAIEKLLSELEEVDVLSGNQLAWIEQYTKYQGISTLSREAVVSLIDRVEVRSDKHINVQFNYRNEIAYCMELAKASVKEVS